MAWDTSEAAVTRSYTSLGATPSQQEERGLRIVARHLECSLSVLEGKRSLAGKPTYLLC